jgi:hypothetical protein
MNGRPRLGRPRAWWALPTLALFAVLAAACGSGNGSAGNGTGGQGSSLQNVTAHALNLTASDLPHGWDKEPQGTGPNVVRSSMNKCLADSKGGTTPVTTADSSNFLDITDGREIGSQVQVYKSAEEAKSAAQTADSSTVSSCLQSAVSTELPKTLPSGETVKHVTVSADAVPGKASDEFGQRVSVLLTYPLSGGHSGGTTVVIDVLGFPSGPALVSAEFESTGSAPTPALERATMAALKKRAAGSS